MRDPVRVGSGSVERDVSEFSRIISSDPSPEGAAAAYEEVMKPVNPHFLRAELRMHANAAAAFA